MSKFNKLKDAPLAKMVQKAIYGGRKIGIDLHGKMFSHTDIPACNVWDSNRFKNVTKDSFNDHTEDARYVVWMAAYYALYSYWVNKPATWAIRQDRAEQLNDITLATIVTGNYNTRRGCYVIDKDGYANYHGVPYLTVKKELEKIDSHRLTDMTNYRIGRYSPSEYDLYWQKPILKAEGV